MGYALNDLDAVEHRLRRPIPFGQHQHAAGAERGDRLLELRPAHRASARRLLFEDALTAFRDECPELPIQVLVLRGDARIADFAHEIPRTLETDFLTTEMVGILGAFQVVTRS